MKTLTWSLATLVLATQAAHSDQQESSPAYTIPAGHWVSKTPQNVHFILNAPEYFSGVVVVNCAQEEAKVRLTVVPDGAEQVREIESSKVVRWKVVVSSSEAQFSGQLIGGNGLLPMVLVDPSAKWLESIGEDSGTFNLSVDDRFNYRLPKSALIASTVQSCEPSTPIS